MIDKHDYEVRPVQDFALGRNLIAREHYAGGSSHTSVYMHGLYERGSSDLLGVAQWLPPTGPAAKSVNPYKWKQVLSLSRLVISPGVQKNAAGFLMARSIRLIRADRRFVSLVTYACDSQGHEGVIYQATNWIFVGKTTKSARWVDSNGKQVAIKSTVSRTVNQMTALGYVNEGSFAKSKYVMHLERTLEAAVLRLEARIQGLVWTVNYG